MRAGSVFVVALALLVAVEGRGLFRHKIGKNAEKHATPQKQVLKRHTPQTASLEKDMPSASFLSAASEKAFSYTDDAEPAYAKRLESEMKELSSKLEGLTHEVKELELAQFASHPSAAQHEQPSLSDADAVLDQQMNLEREHAKKATAHKQPHVTLIKASKHASKKTELMHHSKHHSKPQPAAAAAQETTTAKKTPTHAKHNKPAFHATVHSHSSAPAPAAHHHKQHQHQGYTSDTPVHSEGMKHHKAAKAAPVHATADDAEDEDEQPGMLDTALDKLGSGVSAAMDAMGIGLEEADGNKDSDSPGEADVSAAVEAVASSEAKEEKEEDQEASNKRSFVDSLMDAVGMGEDEDNANEDDAVAAKAPAKASKPKAAAKDADDADDDFALW